MREKPLRAQTVDSELVESPREHARAVGARRARIHDGRMNPVAHDVAVRRRRRDVLERNANQKHLGGFMHLLDVIEHAR